MWLADKGIDADRSGIGGHVWLIIQPDNISELISKGYDKIPGMLDKNGRFVLRAGPDADFGRTGKGKLVKSPYGDSTIAWRQRYEVDSPNYGCGYSFTSGDSDTQFIIDLLEAYNHYDGNLSYDGFAREGFYNSNSFISGILNAAGVKNVPDPWGYQPGLDKPIPLPSTFLDNK